MSAALLLLTLPLFSRPLGWLRLQGKGIPLWGDVPFMDPPELGVLALAVLLLWPERVREAWRTMRGVRCFLLAVCIGETAALFQQFFFRGSWEFFLTAQFYLLMPVAGIALRKELKRLIPPYCALLFLLLLSYTFCIDLSRGGFPGNWNWNFSLLAGTLPAALFIFRKHRGVLSTVLLLSGLGVVRFFCPELLPRGTIAGLVGGGAVLLFSFLFPPKRRWIFAVLTGGAGAVLFLSVLLNPELSSVRDSRVQLWRGSLDLTLANGVTGIGPGRFESRIVPFRPPLYFQTPYPAPLNPHPHNEFLNMWCGFGLAGAAIIALFYTLSFRWLRRRDRCGVYLAYLFLLLLFHGQFDVLLSIPLPGTLYLLSGGVLIAGIVQPGVRAKRLRLRSVAALAALAAGTALGCAEFRSGLHLRRAKLALLVWDRATARREFDAANRLHPSAPGYYYSGRMLLFGFHDPRSALEQLKKVDLLLGTPDYMHNCGLQARARAASGDIGKGTLELFARESVNFPYSLINTKYYLDVVRQYPDSPLRRDLESRYAQLLRLRGITTREQLHRWLRSSELDDSPIQEEYDR